MNDFLELANEQNQKEIANIKACNEITNKYGLILNDKQIHNLLEKRKNALKQTGRVEFRESILEKIIKEFCDSPYITQTNYENILYE